MTLDDKIKHARSLITRSLTRYQRPAFMCSFGKDSMVLLHLLRVDLKLRHPVIFHSDPWWPAKYAFAHKMARTYGLEVHDYPPSFVTLWQGKEIMAFTNHYQTGRHAAAILQMPKNILPPETGKKYLCGLRDVLGRPTGNFNYPWDAVFIGHKSSDADQIAGEIPLHCDVKQNAGIGPDGIFPLREWTDDDVWDYTARFQVPQQEDRYDIANRCERADKRANSDYAHVCIACCDRRETRAAVPCPKLGGLEVANVAAMVPYDTPKFNYFGKPAEAAPC
jgi:3'-phosphoadenosine 5'-phosphosulfate sulfotransferase (PAPS reductase)/FAD synthetase